MKEKEVKRNTTEQTKEHGISKAMVCLCNCEGERMRNIVTKVIMLDLLGRDESLHSAFGH